MPIIWAIVAGTVLASLADWLFMGVLFHDRYNTHPEVWREGRGENQRIILAQAFAVVTAVAFVLLARKLGQTDVRGGVKLGAMIWAIGPLPLLLGNHLFIKLDPRVTGSHAAGWLAKLLLIGGVTGWLL
jgi:hypothetical protein